MIQLELDQVSFRYEDGSIGLDTCSLAIERGSRNVLIGVNGSGKTTLFQHANGLLRPQSGQVRYDGVAVEYNRSGLRELRTRVGMVFQNPDRQLFSASVQEDVSFGPLNLGLDETTVRQRVRESLAAVGMADVADKAVHNLSFGQKKRVCIAGVLAMRPELLVLDEPMAGLDYVAKDELMAVLGDLHAKGITLLLATHDIDFAYRWADRIHLMSDGRCSASVEADRLDEHAGELERIGLPLPGIIELHRRLARLGLPVGPRAPRAHGELLERLEGTPANDKGINMTFNSSRDD